MPFLAWEYRKISQKIKYAESHEWARLETDGKVTVGISDHAQSELGDIVYVELPKVGQRLICKENAGVVESVKASSDIYAPISGEVVEINSNLEEAPELINQSPYEKGWMYRLKSDDALDSLLDESEYLSRQKG